MEQTASYKLHNCLNGADSFLQTKSHSLLKTCHKIKIKICAVSHARRGNITRYYKFISELTLQRKALLQTSTVRNSATVWDWSLPCQRRWSFLPKCYAKLYTHSEENYSVHLQCLQDHKTLHPTWLFLQCVCLPVCLSVCGLSVCLWSVCVSVCLSVCLSVHTHSVTYLNCVTS